MSHSIIKHILLVLYTLALCTTTSFGAWPKQDPDWTRNLEFSIETGLVMPHIFKGDEHARFQTALKDTLAAKFQARGNLEDILLYVSSTGYYSILSNALYPHLGYGNITEAWHALTIPNILQSRPDIRDMLQYDNDEVPRSEVFSDSDEGSNNLPVAEPASKIVKTVRYESVSPSFEVSDEQDNHSYSSPASSDELSDELCEKLKNVFFRLTATLDGQQRFKNVAKLTLSNAPQPHQWKERLALVLTQLYYTTANLLIQQTTRYKLGFSFGYGFSLNDSCNSPQITPKIGINWISIRKYEIPVLGLTFKELYSQIPVALQLRWRCFGLALGYEFDWLLFRSYHAKGYQPQFNLLPSSENAHETVTNGCLEELGKAFCQMNLHFFRGAYLSCKIYLPKKNRNFARNLTALVSALGAPGGELNIGLDLLKLFKKN